MEAILHLALEALVVTMVEPILVGLEVPLVPIVALH
jgi:hypothetical protein